MAGTFSGSRLVLLGARKRFNLRTTLFPTGTEAGLWYDASELAAGKQDSFGTTALYAPGVGSIDPPVGLVLDKRLGLALGADISPASFGVYGSTVSNGGVVPFTATSTVNTSYGSAAGSVLVSGKTYLITFSWSGNTAGRPLYASGGNSAGPGTATVSGTTTQRIVAASTSLYVFASGGLIGESFRLESIKCQLLDGNHSTQSTAASRPLESARLNQLVATATLSTQSATVAAAPQTLSFTGTGTVTLSGVSVAGPLVGTGVNNRVSLTFTPTAGALTLTVTGSVTLAQLEVGSAFTTYQSITDANNYATSGFPLFRRFDGVDDGDATGTIALTANMDCFVVMKRSSAAKFVLFANGLGSATNFFAAADSAGGAAVTSTGAGAALTYAVNNVAVPGGTATTRVQLDTALTVGPWVVMGVYGIDASAWTAFATANYTSFVYTGNIQQIVLAPAQTAAVRTTTCTNLGKAVGLVI